MIKTKKVFLSILTAATIIGSTISFNGVQVLAADSSKGVTIENNKGETAETYTSDEALETSEYEMKTVLKATFIEDPHDNKLTALLTTDGSFINSSLNQSKNYYDAKMIWASSYSVSMDLEDRENDVKIVSSSPTNTITSSQVTNNMGYSIGGSVGMEGKTPNASINANYDYSQSISYDQPNFSTLQTKNTLKNVSWNVLFNSTSTGYDRDSYHGIYGNQIFMESRLNNTGYANLTSVEKLPSLIAGGFSPNFSVALKAPKDKKETTIAVTFSRTLDKYDLNWDGLEWVGYNQKQYRKVYCTKYFVLDWQNHLVKPLYE